MISEDQLNRPLSPADQSSHVLLPGTSSHSRIAADARCSLIVTYAQLCTPVPHLTSGTRRIYQQA